MSVNAVNSDGSLLRVAGGTLYADAPIGTISPFGGSTIPSGYLLCDGQTVSRTTYAELFAVIGTAFGTGDGSTTFNVPDLRETVPVGAGRMTGRDVGAHDVYVVGGFKDDQLQGHWHGDGTTSIVNAESRVGEGFINIFDNEWTNKTDIFTKNTASDGINGTPRIGDTTHGKQLGVNYIIKAKQVAVPFDVAEYIRNQNVLSDYENITLPVSSIPYDGLLTVSVSNGGYVSFSINSRNFTIGSASGTSDTSEITLKKGGNVGFLEAGGTYGIYARYYKLRDYSGR